MEVPSGVALELREEDCVASHNQILGISYSRETSAGSLLTSVASCVVQTIAKDEEVHTSRKLGRWDILILTKREPGLQGLLSSC